MESLPKPDLFFHDSNHSYGWQMTEYAAATQRMKSVAILVSDDVIPLMPSSICAERWGFSRDS